MNDEPRTLQEAAGRILDHASMYDSEALRYSVGINLLRQLETALAHEQNRPVRKDWTP